MRSGKVEGLPYSLSRWTDVPAGKWPWFKQQLSQGYMEAFDPRSSVPSKWSLAPEDTYGLIIWTKNPTNLIKDADLLRHHPLVIHVTLTGWAEVEKNAPSIEVGSRLLKQTVETFGADRVVWRFSPIPQLPHAEVLARFEAIAKAVAEAGLKKTYVVFLQTNDRMPESRSEQDRLALLHGLVSVSHGIDVFLCRDDKLSGVPVVTPGVCEDGRIFGGAPPVMDCGCCLAVDPFTINESCPIGCKYCYAADRTLSPKKRNTTLTILS